MFRGDLEDFLRAHLRVERDTFEEIEVRLTGNGSHFSTGGHIDGPAIGRAIIVVVTGLVKLGEKLLRLRLVAAAVDPAIELRRAEAHARIAHRAETFRRGFIETHPDRRIDSLAGVVKITAQPAGVRAVRCVRRFPYRGGDEMGAVRVRIADALNDAEAAFLEKRSEERHRVVESDPIAKTDQILFLFRKLRPGLVILIVAEWDQRVEPVIPARQLEHDQNRAVLPGGELGGPVARLVAEFRECPVDESRQRPGRRSAQHG